MLLRLDHRPWLFTWFMFADVLVTIALTVVLVVVFHWGVYGVLVGNLVSVFLVNAAALPVYWRQPRVPTRPQARARHDDFAVPHCSTARSSSCSSSPTASS